MSKLPKFLSLMPLTVVLFLVVAGRAQDLDSNNASATVDLPSEIESEPGQSPLQAIETPSPLLPQVPPASRYEAVWENSPFELEAALDVASTAKESFAKDYALSALLKEGDNTIVYIINRKTKETYKVTSEGGGDGGFKLQSLEGASNNVRDVEATIEKDGEVARLTYDKALLAAPAGAALKNHPSSQLNKDDAQNPRNGANNPQDRSGVAAAARLREAALAERSGSGRQRGANGNMGSQASNGASADASADSRSGASPSSSSRRRLVMPKRPVSPEQK